MDSNYNISNGSQSSGASSGGNPYLTQQVVFELFLFFLIIIGNGAVLLVISFGSQTSRMHFVIKNLAFADLCMGLVYLLPRIVMQLSGHVFYGGNALCKIYEFLTHFVYFGSSFIMIALSIDRLIVVANPVRSLETMGRKFKLSVLACWMAACVFGIAGTFLYEYDEMDRECGLIFRTRYEFKVYFVVVLVSQFVIPTLIIGGCYVTIAIIVWRAVRRTKNATGSDYLEIQENLHASSRSRMSASGSTEHNISSAKLKTIKMTFVITLAYVCCWTPFMIFNVLDVHGYFSNDTEMMHIRFFVQSLLPLNSVVNPIIYGVFSSSICSQFKNGLWKKLSTSRSACTKNDTV